MNKLFVWIKRLVLIAVFFIAMAGGLLFAAANSDIVPVTFFGLQFSDIGIGWILIIFFIVGGILGILMSLIPYFSAKKQVILLKHKLNGYEKELAKLRTAPLRN